jgi:hypothetical protein
MRLRIVALTGLVIVATLAAMLAQAGRPDAAMRNAAKALVASLDAAQRAKIQWPFDSEERLNWHYVPIARKGLPLKEMTEPQRTAALALLGTGLSAAGMTRAQTIRNLEDVLKAQGDRIVRDRDLYFFTIFGNPDSGSWGWRYEGHHISQNWTIAGGRAIATTPAFFGANPAEVMTGPFAGTRALAAEEDLARLLLASFTEEQRRLVIVSATSPTEIVTTDSRQAAILANTGLAAGQMTSKQQGLLMSLIEEHASAQVSALAAERLEKIRAAGLSAVRFAWMGAAEKGPGKSHYYRIQGPTFLIEYDNTQDNANHQHVVWRDFNGDFGRDVLGEHYARDHAGDRK